MKRETEHTANLAMAQAPKASPYDKIGKNFAKPLPKREAKKEKSFWPFSKKS